MVGLISFLGSGVEVYSLNNGHTTRSRSPHTFLHSFYRTTSSTWMPQNSLRGGNAGAYIKKSGNMEEKKSDEVLIP